MVKEFIFREKAKPRPDIEKPDNGVRQTENPDFELSLGQDSARLACMRLFLILLMAMIGFSSCSAVAHAFCKPAAAPEASGCPDHDAARNTHKLSGHETPAKGDCAHCFTLPAIDPSGDFAPFPRQIQALNPAPVSESVQGFAFLLLRPPKLFV